MFKVNPTWWYLQFCLQSANLSFVHHRKKMSMSQGYLRLYKPRHRYSELHCIRVADAFVQSKCAFKVNRNKSQILSEFLREKSELLHKCFFFSSHCVFLLQMSAPRVKPQTHMFMCPNPWLLFVLLTGVFEVSCRVTDHFSAGMRLRYKVNYCPQNKGKHMHEYTEPTKIVQYFISAEEIEWDYSPERHWELEKHLATSEERCVSKIIACWCISES